MVMWLLILAAPATVLLWRVIGVAGAIWRERARVTARCLQMDAAATSRAVLCERLPDGTTILVMPVQPEPEQISPAKIIPAVRKPAA
jgi:hypothetical protein